MSPLPSSCLVPTLRMLVMLLTSVVTLGHGCPPNNREHSAEYVCDFGRNRMPLIPHCHYRVILSLPNLSLPRPALEPRSAILS